MTPIHRILAASICVASIVLPSTSAAGFDVPYTKFTLDNGLTVIVHEDPEAQSFDLFTFFRVGSRDEGPGRSGFAHLFEHLMFEGSANVPTDHGAMMGEMGARANGGTEEDYTYYSNRGIPSEGLARMLWLEADRMAYMTITEKSLEEQRGVVQNEKRQRGGKFTTRAAESIREALFPVGHPYRWTVIGSMEDLNAATIEDVESWYQKHNRPNNAVIFIGGGVKTEDVKRLAEKYFGSLPSGEAITRLSHDVPKRDRNTRAVVYEPATAGKIVRGWVLPAAGSREFQHVSLALGVLTDAADRWLKKSLIEDTGLASKVDFSIRDNELASHVQLTVNLKPGADAKEASRILDETLAEFAARGPDEDELELFRLNESNLDALRFSVVEARLSKLIGAEMFAGDAGFYKQLQSWRETATTDDVRTAVGKWLAGGYHEVTLMPSGTRERIVDTLDRSEIPPVASKSGAIEVPEVETARLKNGIEVSLISVANEPIVRLNVTSSLPRQALGKIGNPMAIGAMRQMFGLATSSLDEAALKRAQIHAGLSLGPAGRQPTTWTIGYSLRRDKLSEGMKLGFEILTDVAITPDTFAKIHEKLKVDQDGSADSAFRYTPLVNGLLFDDTHPYAHIPDVGTAEMIENLTLEDVRQLNSDYWHPETASIQVVGDLNIDELTAALNKTWGRWDPAGDAPAHAEMSVSPKPKGKRIILFDAPGLQQSGISFYTTVPRMGAVEDLTWIAANDILGRGGKGRLHQNLREEKGWTYGVNSYVYSHPGQATISMSGSFQTDKTAESLAELWREVSEFSADRPATAEEFETYRQAALTYYAKPLATPSAKLNYLSYPAELAQPLVDRQRLAEALKALTLEEVQATASELFSLDNVVVMIGGDLTRFEDKIRALDLDASIEVWDLDGNRVR